MKKYNSILHNKNILYLLFILTIINIGYFLYLKDNYSILNFTLIIALIYLFTKNMIIVLGLAIIIIHMLLLAKTTLKEGYTDASNNECSNFTDTVYKNLYSSDISGVPTSITHFKTYLKEYIKDARDGNDTSQSFYNKYTNGVQSLDIEAQEWLKKHVINMDTYKDICKSTGIKSKKESLQNELDGDTIKDVEDQSKKLNNTLVKVKNENPDLEESLKLLNGVDMNELNKLINKLNTFTDSFTKKSS